MAWARAHPVEFIRDFLGETLWQAQEQIIESVRDNPITLVNACHDSGKSWLAARALIWFLVSHPQSKVITTGPGFRTVKEVVWRELAVLANKLKDIVPIKMNQTSVEIAPDWFALGVASDEPGRIQGIAHARHTLIIVDESCEMAAIMWPAVLSLLASSGSKLLCLTNPLKPVSQHGDFWRSGSDRINRITISCFDTPNFVDNKIDSLETLASANMEKLTINWPTLLDPKWVKDRVEDWTTKAPDFIGRVFGRFPDSNVGSLVSLERLEAAFSRTGFDRQTGDPRWGLDVARYGSDNTCLCDLAEKDDEITVYGFDRWQYAPADVSVDRVKAKVPQDELINTDSVGVGGPVHDYLRRDGWRSRAIGFGENPNTLKAAERYKNKRAEYLFHLAKRIEDGRIHLGRVKHLRKEITNGLVWLTYELLPTGKYKIIEKSKAKENAGIGAVGFDEVDALALGAYRQRLRYVS